MVIRSRFNIFSYSSRAHLLMVTDRMVYSPSVLRTSHKSKAQIISEELVIEAKVRNRDWIY